MSDDGNYPEKLYDVDKIADQAKDNNKHLKKGFRRPMAGDRNHKTRDRYSFGSEADDILFGKPQPYTCECGWKTNSAFKSRTCDECGKEMILDEA